MKSNEGDGETAAELLIMPLMVTIRMTHITLALKLRHIVYDVVYELSGERVRGGGGLSLIEHVAEILGVEKGSITGHWDTGHKMQLVYNDVLPKDKMFGNDEKFVFRYYK